MRNKIFLGLAAAIVGVIGLAAPAGAHVTVNPNSAAQGSYAKLTFRMPNETAALNATKLEVQMPADHPLASVSVQPQSGWTYSVEKSALATPIQTDDGPLTDYISKITWTATDGGLKPGEFGEFNVSGGPLPSGVGSISFKALQTYSDGSVVRWIDDASANNGEPEHPAPTLTLTPASATADQAAASTQAATSKSSNDNDSDAALVVGIVALVVGVLSLILTITVAARRKA